MKKLLYLILFTALFFRLIGITHGYPPYHSDEGMSYSQGIQIVLESTLNANGYTLHYAYPGLIPLIHAVLYKTVFIPLGWVQFYVSHIGEFIDGLITFPIAELDKIRIFRAEILGEREIHVLVWGRIVTAIWGVMSVWLIYILASEMFTKKIGLVAALLLAVNYRHVLNSHIALPDIYNGFFLLLSLVFSYRLIKSPTKRNYLFAGLGVGLFITTKFHIYSVLPFVFAHIYAQKAKLWEIKKLINRELLLAIAVGMLILIVINPWHWIRYEDTIEQLRDVSLKYQAGKNTFDFFPYSYLYHYGLGKVLSIVSGVGMLFYWSKAKEKVILLSAVMPFLLVITYLTGGGFYTRNLITIIPILIIFASLALVSLFNKKGIYSLMSVVLGILCILPNVQRSVIVAKEYSGEWNYLTLKNWIEKNISTPARVAAHSSVIIDNSSIVRLPFELEEAFSIREFAKNEADFAVINLDWATTSFYGWMIQDTKGSLKNWEKPVDELEENYAAMAIREFADYGIFSATNNAFAPDSDFVVAKVPKIISARNKEQITPFSEDINLQSNFLRSDPIEVHDWEGMEIVYSLVIKESDYEREGFVFVEFYSYEANAQSYKDRVAVRVSERGTIGGPKVYSFPIKIPADASYAVVGLGLYEKTNSKVYFKDVTVYKAEVEELFDEWEVKKTNLGTDNIFPNSHGNL